MDYTKKQTAICGRKNIYLIFYFQLKQFKTLVIKWTLCDTGTKCFKKIDVFIVFTYKKYWKCLYTNNLI